MQEFFAVVTRKGQITVPAEIRRALGLCQGDKVALVMDKRHAQLRRAGSVVERTAGILKGGELPLTAEELRGAAEHAIAEAAVKRMGE